MLRNRIPAGLIAMTAFMLLTACSKEAPEQQARQPSAASAKQPLGIAGGPYRIYVTNEMSGDLTVIDGADHSVIGSFALGKRPRGVRASPDGALLYVALSGSPISPPGVDPSTLSPADKAADGIGVFDATRKELVKVLRGFSDPEQLAVSSDGDRMYIASEDTGMAVIADGATGAVRATLPVGGEPEGVALSIDGRHVYVSSEEHHQIAVIDTASEQVISTVKVGKRPRDIAFSPDGARAYISGESDASLTVVDAKTHQPVGTVSIPGENARPMGVVVAPDNSRVYVTTGRGGAVAAIDTATLAVIGSVKVGERPWGIAISPDGSLLYTANGPSNDVSIVDTQKLELLGNIPVGDRPWGVAVAPPPSSVVE